VQHREPLERRHTIGVRIGIEGARLGGELARAGSRVRASGKFLLTSRYCTRPMSNINARAGENGTISVKAPQRMPSFATMRSWRSDACCAPISSGVPRRWTMRTPRIAAHPRPARRTPSFSSIGRRFASTSGGETFVVTPMRR
jgi:hypothetical protein